MPTYEYECRKCGHKLEKFQSITAAPLKKCPSCGKMSLHRLLGAGAGRPKAPESKPEASKAEAAKA